MFLKVILNYLKVFSNASHLNVYVTCGVTIWQTFT